MQLGKLEFFNSNDRKIFAYRFDRLFSRNKDCNGQEKWINFHGEVRESQGILKLRFCSNPENLEVLGTQGGRLQISWR